MARSRRACPERSRGNLGGAYLPMLFGPFSDHPKPENRICCGTHLMVTGKSVSRCCAIESSRSPSKFRTPCQRIRATRRASTRSIRVCAHRAPHRCRTFAACREQHIPCRQPQHRLLRSTGNERSRFGQSQPPVLRVALGLPQTSQW